MSARPYLASEHVIMFASLLHFTFHLLHACFVFFVTFVSMCLLRFLPNDFYVSLCCYILHFVSTFHHLLMCMICVFCVFHFSVFVEIFIVKAFTSFRIHINNFFSFFLKCDNLYYCCVATSVEVICIMGL
jgi:hypothetical protein